MEVMSKRDKIQLLQGIRTLCLLASVAVFSFLLLLLVLKLKP